MASQGQAGYEPMAPSYQPQSADAPPPYYQQAQPPPPQMQTPYQSHFVVVQQQPQVVHVTRTYWGTGDYGLGLALVATFMSILFCCCIPLLCSLLAICLSCKAQTQAAHGNLEAARQSRSMSVGLSIAAIITGVLIYFVWIIPTACCY